MEYEKPDDYRGYIYVNQQRKRTNIIALAASYLLIIVLAFFVIFCNNHTAKVVIGESMLPTINTQWSYAENEKLNYDIVLVDKTQTAQKNDIIIINYFDGVIHKLLIKRLIAVGGDKLSITWDNASQKAVVRVNDEILNEPYLGSNNWQNKANLFNNNKNSTNWQINQNETTKIEPLSDEFGSIIIPKGYFFALGDNRNDSLDCAYFGPLQNKEILGVVDTIAPYGTFLNTILRDVFGIKSSAG